MRSTPIIVIVFIAVMDLLPLHLIAQSKRKIGTVDSGFAQVNGTKLYYEIAGKGKPLVLIHGSFGDRRHWDFQFKELSNKYKVLRYDVRGYGKSALPNPDEPYRDADDLNALMDFLEIKKAYICGLSMGSVIAVDFVLAYPEKCRSLIPIGARVAGDGLEEYKTPNSDTLKATISKMMDILKNNGTKQATDYLWTGNHSLSKGVVSSGTRAALLKMGYEYSWWRYLYANKREQAFPTAINKLTEIKIPTLVVTAEYDFEFCKEIAAVIAKKIVGAKLISIKGAGHIMNMDNPGEFNKAISEFIDKVK
jgi:pimeloyl-ACP methyl ester carboxylesterase